MSQKPVPREGQRKGDFLAGKYLLGDCLGIGGMGEVYRATNVSLGRDVAVKILSHEHVDNEDDVLRFLREARAAALVRHANVVDVLDVARDDDGTPFIVQELLSGEDLERYLATRGGRVSAEEALEIMIPVADAVSAAHHRQVVHRDLKPANIFLAREGNTITPKVLDFGASRYATVGDLSASERRILIGTPHYMAPEQVQRASDVDARVDVWALGVILYEMLVGETPFEAEGASAVMKLVKTRDVPPLAKVAKSARREVADVVARCTERDKTKRYTHAGELAKAMRHARDAMRGAVRARVDTAPEIDDVASAPDLDLPKPNKPPPPPPRPAPPRAAGPAKSHLLTLSSPGGSDAPPPAQKAQEALLDELALDEPAVPRLDLDRSSAPSRPSSIPPVLDPRAAATPPPARATPSVEPPAPQADWAAPERHSFAGGAPAAVVPPAASRQEDAPHEARPGDRLPIGAKITLAAATISPAVLAFVALRIIPLTAPLGRALRGDAVLPSGVLTVLVLILAAVLTAKSMAGTRDRTLFVATGGAVLWGIVMIIVTFSAGELPDAGEGASGGIAVWVAPITPLTAAWAALARARKSWTAKYDARERVIFAAVASSMLLVALEVGPLGAARSARRLPASPATSAPSP